MQNKQYNNFEMTFEQVFLDTGLLSKADFSSDEIFLPDKGVDSIKYVQIITELENVFDITFDLCYYYMDEYAYVNKLRQFIMTQLESKQESIVSEQ